MYWKNVERQAKLLNSVMNFPATKRNTHFDAMQFTLWNLGALVLVTIIIPVVLGTVLKQFSSVELIYLLHAISLTSILTIQRMVWCLYFILIRDDLERIKKVLTISSNHSKSTMNKLLNQYGLIQKSLKLFEKIHRPIECSMFLSAFFNLVSAFKGLQNLAKAIIYQQGMFFIGQYSCSALLYIYYFPVFLWLFYTGQSNSN